MLGARPDYRRKFARPEPVPAATDFTDHPDGWIESAVRG